jgi:hypothetical protein
LIAVKLLLTALIAVTAPDTLPKTVPPIFATAVRSDADTPDKFVISVDKPATVVMLDEIPAAVVISLAIPARA